MEFPKRKKLRLSGYDYSTNGVYFITICTQNKRQLLGTVVGGADLGALIVKLSHYGGIVHKYLSTIETSYNSVIVDKYVIMPNHIHLIVIIQSSVDGMPGSLSPTGSFVPNIITAFKKLTNRESGFSIWQRSYHDRIVRNQEEYEKIWTYIDTNPIKWNQDCYYVM